MSSPRDGGDSVPDGAICQGDHARNATPAIPGECSLAPCRLRGFQKNLCRACGVRFLVGIDKVRMDKYR
jgi:hypothetical protein